MALEQQIDDLPSLLANFLGENKKILSHETARLTAPGDNYGSTMLSVKITIKNQENSEKEELDLVAKLPPSSEFMKKLFNTPVTFRNEVGFYQKIVPVLQDFIKSQGFQEPFDCFPQSFGARLGKIEQQRLAGDDAVLLMENLTLSGFECVERTLGFDLHTTKMILKSLALFHAAPIALKFRDPEQFADFKELLSPFKVFELDAKIQENAFKSLVRIAEQLDEIKEYLPRVQKACDLNRISHNVKNDPNFIREPFATIVHIDAWVNNFMVKFVEGQAKDVKILDLQLYEYGSPARDVIFFIFTSVHIPVVERHLNELLQFYHDNLINDLKFLNCDTTQLSFEKFRDELKIAVQCFEFVHTLLMLEPICQNRDSAMTVDEISENDLQGANDKTIPQIHKDRVVLVVREFAKQGWI